MSSPPLLRPRQVAVRPIPTIHMNPRASERQRVKRPIAAAPARPGTAQAQPHARRGGAPGGAGGVGGASAGIDVRDVGADPGPLARGAPAAQARGEGPSRGGGGSDAVVALDARGGEGAERGPEQSEAEVQRMRVTSKMVTIAFPADDPSGRREFVGAVKGGRPHGHGTLLWESGSRYEGTFKRGDLNGFGRYEWANGTYYSGEWVNGAMHGTGVMVTSAGDRYEGAWDLNRKHGFGVYTWGNGDSYSGEFRDDVMHGFGVCAWPNGRRVELVFEDEFPATANRAAMTLWLCFVSLSVLFLASLFPHSPLRMLHSLWPFSRMLLPSSRRWAQAEATAGPGAAAGPPPSSASLVGVDWLSQFPYYLHLVLLFANQRLLREFFAQVIWKVAQTFCHLASPSVLLLGRLSDAACWRTGIALGYLSVCTFFLFSFSIVNAASYI